MPQEMGEMHMQHLLQGLEESQFSVTRWNRLLLLALKQDSGPEKVFFAPVRPML